MQQYLRSKTHTFQQGAHKKHLASEEKEKISIACTLEILMNQERKQVRLFFTSKERVSVLAKKTQEVAKLFCKSWKNEKNYSRTIIDSNSLSS